MSDQTGNTSAEEAEVANERFLDTGLASLVLVLGRLDIPVDTDVLRRMVGQHGRFEVADIMRGAELSGVRAEHLHSPPGRLTRLPMPFVARYADGSFVVVADVRDGRVLLRDPRDSASRTVPVEEFQTRWPGHAVLLRSRRTRRADGGDGGLRGFARDWVLPELMRHKGALFNVLAASLLIQVFALVTPLFTMVVIDKVLSNSALSTLDVLAIGLVAIALFDLLIGALRSHLLGDLSNRMDARLSAGLFGHMMRLPLAFYRARPTGDTVSRMRELEAVRNFFTGPSLTAVIDFPFTIVFLVVMFWFSVPLTLLVIGAIFVLLIMYGLVGGILRERIRRKNESHADNQSFLVEGISSIETFKALAVEPQIQRQWEDRIVEGNEVSRQTEQLNHNLMQAAGFINKLTIALGLWFGAKAVLAGGMTAGQLIGFNMMISRVLAPAMRIAQLFQHVQQTRVAVRRIAELFDAQPEYGQSSSVSQLPAIRGRVTLENVTFAYEPDGPNVLEDIDLDVEPGEVIGVTGISGSGKTTLIQLLQRMYVPQKGRVLMDGVNIARADPAWLRRQIGVVPQDVVLLNRSIRENISVVDPGMPMEQVEGAARLAGADAFIRNLPDAYETVVGERGANLSMGQRQRIALARALALNPRVLVLDEATSALDQEAEQLVQRNMQRITRGRTVFVVAHRLSTLSVADRIVVLEGGRLAESGTLRELLEMDGVFARLYRSQLAALRRRRARARPAESSAGASAQRGLQS